MDELTITDIVYMAMAVRMALEKDLSKQDREMFEKLWMKLKLSHKGIMIQNLFCHEDERVFK